MGGHIHLTRQSLRERELLLREIPGLVDPLGFLFSDYRGRGPGRWSFTALLLAYDLVAGRRTRRYYPVHEYALLAPRIKMTDLKGGAQCYDAVTDDARLVLRTIREAQQDGALALNYVSAEQLLWRQKQVCGIGVRDAVSGKTAEITAKVVINATGAWADRLRTQVKGAQKIRPLRGSHLVFPFWRIPVGQTLALTHPSDGRGVYLLPWEGVTIVGCTDLDHGLDLDEEPSISPQEVDYLLEFVHFQFPGLGIQSGDVQGTFSGIRPVIGSGALSPSKEKRDHSIWEEHGLVSVTGGKLTTFRVIAQETLRRSARSIPSTVMDKGRSPFFRGADAKEPPLRDLAPRARRRLTGRYGMEALPLIHGAGQGELEPVPGTDTLWAELRWAARSEQTVHLEDLLLRRTRLGILLKDGGAAHLKGIQEICGNELDWGDERWDAEIREYLRLWPTCYGMPG
jgi:glycerol-3-phosphate dehydrogenase